MILYNDPLYHFLNVKTHLLKRFLVMASILEEMGSKKRWLLCATLGNKTMLMRTYDIIENSETGQENVGWDLYSTSSMISGL
jgi:hypothetical protein